VVATVQTSHPLPEVSTLARDLDLPLLRGPGAATRALARVARPSSLRAHVAAAPRPFVDLSDLVTTDGPLPEHESATILERYGIAFPARRRVRSAAEAAEAAADLGFPVVVKVDGPPHKARGGGVAVGVGTPEAAAEEATRLGGRVLVARQVPRGPEALCGLVRDPLYGPLLTVGIDREAALELVDEAPGLAAVAGDAARAALAAALVALGRLALDHPEVAAVDVNPLILSADGAVAVDALVVVDGGGSE
jgi:acetyltransferase